MLNITGKDAASLSRRVVPVLMSTYLFFNPFPHTTSIKEICFYISLFIAFAIVLTKKEIFFVKAPITIPFGLFALWSFCTIFFSLDQANSIHDFRSHLVKYMLFFFIMVNYFMSKKLFLTISWIVVISTSLASIVGLWYFYGILGHPIGERFGGGPEFSEVPVNQIGILTVFAITLCLNHIKGLNGHYAKVGGLLLLLLLILASIMTQSRSFILATFVIFLLMAIGNQKVVTIIFLLFISMIALLPVRSRLLNDIKDNIRIRQNFINAEIIKDYPIFGIGYGLKKYGDLIDIDAYRERLPQKWRHQELVGIPHSILMKIAVRTGLVGLALFFWMLYAVFKMCWTTMRYSADRWIRNWSRCLLAAFSGFFIIGIFEPVFFHAGEVVLHTIFAMITILWRLDNQALGVT